MLVFVCAMSLLGVLLFQYSDIIKTGSVDVVSHYALVDELMTHWRVRPADSYLGPMLNYPDLSHWLAALLGMLIGDGLLAMSALAIAAVFVCYYSIGRILTDPAAALVFGILFLLMAPTNSLIGWEVVINFFYPQIIAFAMYFWAMLWCVSKNPTPQRVATFGLWFLPIIFFTQPIAGVHAGAMLMTAASVSIVSSRRWKEWFWLVMIGMTTCVSMFLVRSIIVNASNDGDLNFYFGTIPIAIPIGICTVAALLNFLIAKDRNDQILGGTTVCSILLLGLQWLVLVTLHAGSPYAIHKHIFIAMTLGLMNGARLISRGWRSSQSAYAPVVLACLATIIILRQPTFADVSVSKVRKLSNFAKRFTDHPEYQPGNTDTRINSGNPIVDMLISNVFFKDSIDKLYHEIGQPPNADFFLIDHKPRAGCEVVFSDSEFFIVPKGCN